MRQPRLIASCFAMLLVCHHSAAKEPSVAIAYPPLQRSALPFQAPPFDRFDDGMYRPAIEEGMKLQRAEIQAIDDNPAAPTFDNTIVALERSGVALRRARRVFDDLVSSAANDRLRAARTALAPELSAHSDAIDLDPVLFARIEVVHAKRLSSGLDPVSIRLVERYRTRFVRSGALLDADHKAALMALNSEESTLTSAFADHILDEVKASAIIVDRREDLEGLSEDEIATAAAAAKARDLDGRWLIALQNTTTQPLLGHLANRGLRERIYRASVERNTRGKEDNGPIITRLAQLRAESAALLGYPSYAAYVIDDQMARTPEAATRLLADLAPAAARNAKAEAVKLQAVIDRQHGGFVLQPWDWDFYAEQVRLADYALDEAAIKPYFEFERVLHDGLFFAANRLYGLTFRERRDLPVYRADVRVFEVDGPDGRAFALFYLDAYAHDGKSGGAWMNTLVDQTDLLAQPPVVVNNLNIVTPAAGQPTLMTSDEVTAMFHEFGHGLHGLLSRQRYPMFSGADVTADFVEFPSQFNENWALEPTVLAHYAKHYRTGAQMPQELVDRILRSRRFNQGYLSTEYIAAALLDLEWHSRPVDAPRVADVAAFEQAALAKYGLDLPEVPPRYRSRYFSHSWGGYSANYYAYLWAEVLALDGYQWFVEHGGMTRTNGLHFRDTVLSQGGSKDAAQLYRDFRGRDPDVGPLLERRGLR